MNSFSEDVQLHYCFYQKIIKSYSIKNKKSYFKQFTLRHATSLLLLLNTYWKSIIEKYKVLLWTAFLKMCKPENIWGISLTLRRWGVTPGANTLPHSNRASLENISSGFLKTKIKHYKMLNVITDNVTIWLLWSDWSSIKTHFINKDLYAGIWL